MRDSVSQNSTFQRFGERVRRFVKLESSAGIILFVATVLAMLVKNSPLSKDYLGFLNLPGVVQVGPLVLAKPLFLWVNDAWMAVFFFLVGMEIKREVQTGHLSQRSQLVLPTAGAIGGMVIPAAIYLAINAGSPETRAGWAIPMATDIAFALGVLALLGSKVPIALRIFLMTLAVLDDLGAIVVIALFYTSQLSPTAALAGAVCTVCLILLNRLGVRNLGAYVILGLILWVCVLKSGVHATLAGVITAFAIPGRRAEDGAAAPLEKAIHVLHPWVAFCILPMFAFVNAGIAFQGLELSALAEPLPLGILLGLVVGKPLGVFGCAWLVVKMRWASLPPSMTWISLLGIAFLCGIGFTMSIFVGALAFQDSGLGYARIDRLAVILGSLATGTVGFAVLALGSRAKSQDGETNRY